MAMIEIDNLHHNYDGIRALSGVGFRVARGETAVVMGSNGAGKTTLLRHLNGLLKPDRGRVVVDGLDMAAAPPSQAVRRVGLVFQNPQHMFFAETVWKEVAFYPKNLGLSDVEDRVERLLRKLDLWELKDKSPFALSQGEQRRVAIAAVLAGDPPVIGLDEPISWLDADQTARVAELIQGLEDKTIVIATHAIDWAMTFTDQLILLQDGKLLAAGKTQEIVRDRALFERAGLRRPEIIEWGERIGIAVESVSEAVQALLERAS
ncbi:MAG: energy-coupling factor ABC transporter ATP-binding protein [Candidatus Bipolaricaulia bacterium]